MKKIEPIIELIGVAGLMAYGFWMIAILAKKYLQPLNQKDNINL